MMFIRLHNYEDGSPRIVKPSTISRRGFLRALGITTTTLLLGEIPRVVAAERTVQQLDIDWIRLSQCKETGKYSNEARIRVDSGEWELATSTDGVLRLPGGLSVGLSEYGGMDFVSEPDGPFHDITLPFGVKMRNYQEADL